MITPDQRAAFERGIAKGRQAEQPVRQEPFSADVPNEMRAAFERGMARILDK